MENITDENELLHDIICNLEYNFYPDEYGFQILTNVRYRNMSSIKEAYLCSLDGSKSFKITCEEVDITSLPYIERNNLENYLKDQKITK